jgi:hypothetical protein
MSQKFISPYDHKAPAGAEGWKELYPYYMVFQDNLKETEENKNSELIFSTISSVCEAYLFCFVGVSFFSKVFCQ